MVDSLDALRIFAYHQSRVSELALCHPGGNRRPVLWLDVEEDGIDLCVGAGTRSGGYRVAFPVPNFLRNVN